MPRSLKLWCLLAVVSLPGCFLVGKRITEPIETSQTPIVGTNYKVIHGVQCTFKELNQSLYDVLCVPVTRDDSGNEVVATSLPPDARLEWKPPVRVYGSSFTANACQISPSGLSQRCEIMVPETIATLIRFDAELRQPNAQSVTHSGFVLLPISVASFGLYPQAPLAFNLFDPDSVREKSENSAPAGFTNIELDPFSFFQAITSACSYDDTKYFVAGSQIFRLRNGRVTLFAGSTHSDNLFTYDDRLRLSLVAPRLRCGARASAVGKAASLELIVTDAGRHQVLTMSEERQVSAIGRYIEPDAFLTSPDGTKGAEASINPLNAVRGPDGILYFIDSLGLTVSQGLRVRYVDAEGRLKTAVNLPEFQPRALTPPPNVVGLIVRDDGAFVVSDPFHHQVLRAERSGSVTRIAGLPFANGSEGYSGDGGPAEQSKLNAPSDLRLTPTGEILLVDLRNGRIRKIEKNGIISTVAGREALAGEDVWTSEGKSASEAIFQELRSIDLEKDGTLIIADGTRLTRIRSGKFERIAGAKSVTFAADGANATQSQIGLVSAVASKNDGTTVFSDHNQQKIRAVDAAGRIRTIVGIGAPGQAGSEPVYATEIVTDSNDRLVWFDQTTGMLMRLEGQTPIAIAGSGVVDAITFGGDGGPATSSSVRFDRPQGIAIGPDGSFYIADTYNHRIRKVDTSGVLTTIAGNGTAGFGGDGGNPLAATLNLPLGVSVGEDGSVFVADTLNRRIRRIKNGTIETIVGGGTCSANQGCFDGPATAVQLEWPNRVKVGPQGILFINDPTRGRVFHALPLGGSGTTAYRLSLLVQRKDDAGGRYCGNGQSSKRVAAGAAREEFSASLATACIGRVVTIAVKGSCGTDSNGSFTLLIGQVFGPFGNILKGDAPCGAL